MTSLLCFSQLQSSCCCFTLKSWDFNAQAGMAEPLLSPSAAVPSLLTALPKAALPSLCPPPRCGCSAVAQLSSMAPQGTGQLILQLPTWHFRAWTRPSTWGQSLGADTHPGMWGQSPELTCPLSPTTVPTPSPGRELPLSYRNSANAWVGGWTDRQVHSALWETHTEPCPAPCSGHPCGLCIDSRAL